MKHSLFPVMLLEPLAPMFWAAETGPSPSPSAPPSSTIPSNGNYAQNFKYQMALSDQLIAKKGISVDLIFIGDSITAQWRNGDGAPVWMKYYENRAIDFGVCGDRTEHVLWRLDNLPVRNFHPKVAVIMIGTNNCDPESTPESISEGVKAVIARTQKTFPGVKIILVSILPNARANDKMAAANVLIKNLADGDAVTWLDLASKFTAEGDNWKGLQNDKLHLSTKGYEMWAEELNPILEKLTLHAQRPLCD